MASRNYYEALVYQPPFTRAERFERFKRACRERRIPVPEFAEFCALEDQYDREWEVATYEWEQQRT